MLKNAEVSIFDVSVIFCCCFVFLRINSWKWNCWAVWRLQSYSEDTFLYRLRSLGSVLISAFFLSFIVGLYYCFSNLSDARIFIIMYGVTSMYFSAVMVRNELSPN